MQPAKKMAVLATLAGAIDVGAAATHPDGARNGLAIVSSNPPTCVIDARQPHAPDDDATKFGWDSIDITFNGDVSGLSPFDFVTRQTPILLPPEPTIMTVLQLSPDTVRLVLSGPINPGTWTSFELINEAEQRVCLGYLPGDVTQDRLSARDDIDALIDSINGVPGKVLPEYATDIDRSEVTNGDDVSRLTDVLDGNQEFVIWEGESLPPALCECPGACCIEGQCTDRVARAECTAAMGIYQGDGTLCATLTCPEPQDCNDNGIPDECDIACGPSSGVCDMPGCGQSVDANANGIPDECEALSPIPTASEWGLVIFGLLLTSAPVPHAP